MQLPFTLPPIDREHTRRFVETLAADLPGACQEVFALGLEANPRRIKRTINVFTLLQLLIAQRAELRSEVDPELLAKTVIVQAAHRDLHDDLLPYPNLLIELEAHFDEQKKRESSGSPPDSRRAISGAGDRDARSIATPLASEEGTLLSRYANRRPLRDLLLCGERRFCLLGQTTDRATERFRRVYLSLVQTVGEPTRAEDTRPLDEQLRADLLSADITKIRAACDRIQADEAEGYRRQLLGAMNDPAAEVEIRVSAGDSLGYLGDPRFRANACFLPDDELGGFVEIPAGRFVMGSGRRDMRRLSIEFAEHEVELPAFYIARYPVTVAQFKAFVDDSPGPGLARRWPNDQLLNHPISSISWDEAKAYCDWLTVQLRTNYRAPRLLADLVRGLSTDGRKWRVTLPSEAEWEKAARGPAPSRRMYPWGDEPAADAANFDAAGIGRTSAVGCFPKGASQPYGILDLAGNVWEWTRSVWGKSFRTPDRTDRYEPDDKALEDLNTPAAVHRVLRGGAFLDGAGIIRCAVRSRARPNPSGGHIGFRVALSPIVSDS